MTAPVRSTKSAKIWRRLLVGAFLILAVYSPVAAVGESSGWWQAYYVASGALWLWWAIAGIVRISREPKEGE